MSQLNMTIMHKLSREEALKRIKAQLLTMMASFGGEIRNLRESWHENILTFSFSVMAFNVSGRLVVKEGTIELFGKLPFAANFFKGEIKSRIRERAESILA